MEREADIDTDFVDDVDFPDEVESLDQQELNNVSGKITIFMFSYPK